MDDLIRSLDDITAQRVLSLIACGRAQAGADTIPWTPDLRQAVADAFELSAQPVTVSEGELARQALIVLADDPDTRQAIATMAANLPESPSKFDAGATLAIATAVLIVLQTNVRFQRDEQGKWTLTIEKKPTSERLLKDLARKLLAYLPKSS